MKKTLMNILILSISINLLVEASSEVKKDIKVLTQNHSSIKLRHGYGYKLYNRLTSRSHHLFISNFNGSIFSERDGDFNGRENPEFAEANTLIENKHQIPPNTTMKTFEQKTRYNIHYYPKKRKKDNLYIEYHTRYYTWINNEWVGPTLFITKQPYEITWCGDGIVDNYIDIASNDKIKEICDPKDANKKNWGKVGCSTKCTPLN